MGPDDLGYVLFFDVARVFPGGVVIQNVLGISRLGGFYLYFGGVQILHVFGSIYGFHLHFGDVLILYVFALMVSTCVSMTC